MRIAIPRVGKGTGSAKSNNPKLKMRAPKPSEKIGKCTAACRWLFLFRTRYVRGLAHGS